MIVVHHLEYSRSTRILWLLEELGEPYEMVRYQRDAKSFRAPPALKEAHPLGKAPVVHVDGRPIAESGAILEFLAAKYGGGRLARSADDAGWADYLEWLHFGEGTAMTGVILLLIAGREPESGAARYGRELAESAMALLEQSLQERDYLLESGFSAADIQIAYVAAFAGEYGLLNEKPAVRAWLDRCMARDGYKRAIDKGGPMLLPRRG